MAREMIVVPFDDMWAEMYEKEKNILSRIFGNFIISIQHFGSTSIKGMSAKPIIDIMIIVDDINQVDNYNDIMVSSKYSVRGESGIDGRRYFVKLTSDNSGNHSHHIHVYEKGNKHIADELMFRDYLLVDSEAYNEYEKTKLDAAVKFRNSPVEYVNAKYDCIMKIMEKAKAYYKNEYNPYLK